MYLPLLPVLLLSLLALLVLLPSHKVLAACELSYSQTSSSNLLSTSQLVLALDPLTGLLDTVPIERYALRCYLFASFNSFLCSSCLLIALLYGVGDFNQSINDFG
jgi:hypothetical protein